MHSQREVYILYLNQSHECSKELKNEFEEKIKIIHKRKHEKEQLLKEIEK
jgi:hypothetical protein